jgi:hypothetical protein
MKYTIAAAVVIVLAVAGYFLLRSPVIAPEQQATARPKSQDAKSEAPQTAPDTKLNMNPTEDPTPGPGFDRSIPPAPMDVNAIPLNAKSKPIITRTGARLSTALKDENYYVTYVPQPDVHMTKLDTAVEGKNFGFEVQRFGQSTSQEITSGFHVERAGEIVAAAIAQQLDSMGYQVALDLTEALITLREKLDGKFDIDPASFQARVAIAGDVRFWIEHLQNGKEYQTLAKIDLNVRLRGVRGGESTELFKRRVEDKESSSSDSLTGSSDRARMVAHLLLHRVIQALVTDADLETALVRFVSP